MVQGIFLAFEANWHCWHSNFPTGVLQYHYQSWWESPLEHHTPLPQWKFVWFEQLPSPQKGRHVWMAPYDNLWTWTNISDFSVLRLCGPQSGIQMHKKDNSITSLNRLAPPCMTLSEEGTKFQVSNWSSMPKPNMALDLLLGLGFCSKSVFVI